MDWVASFAALPGWAQVLAVVIFAVSGAFFVVVTKRGIAQGAQTPAAIGTSTATVAAVIVDSSALDRATGELSGLIVELAKLTVVGERLISSNAEIAKSVGDLGESIDKLRDEVIRSAAQMRK